jgi:hypothetical protein
MSSIRAFAWDLIIVSSLVSAKYLRASLRSLYVCSLYSSSVSIAPQKISAMRSVFEIGAEKITIYRFRPLPGTAFEKFKVRVNADSRKILKYAIRLNRVRKELLVGNVVKAVAAPGTYAYPLQGGPVIRLKKMEGPR